MLRVLSCFLGIHLFLSLPAVAVEENDPTVRIARVDVKSNTKGNVTASQTVTVDMMVDRKHQPFKLVLRAFLILGEEKERSEPIKRLPQKDAPGNVEFITEITAPVLPETQPTGLVTKEFHVSLDDMSLPNGENNELAYVATAYVPGVDGKQRLISDMPSLIQKLLVTNTRRQVLEEPALAVPPPSKLERAQIILKDGTVDTNGPLVTTFPSQAPEGSITEEALEAALQEQQKKQPKALAALREDVPQDLAGEENQNIVYWATNRVVTTVGRGQYAFGNKSAVLEAVSQKADLETGITWGTSLVDLPTREQEQAWFASKKAQLVNGKTILYFDKDQFLNRLSSKDPQKSKDVLLFIHGYANTMESVILQAARMKRDLAFWGNVMAYGWNSKGEVDSYGTDHTQSENAHNLAAFDAVLRDVVTQVKESGGRIFLLAHSMGNRYMAHALSRLYLDKEIGERLLAEPAKKRTIAVAAFAAPDVKSDFFTSMMSRVVNIADIKSFYFTTKDRALKLSKTYHGTDRAGLNAVVMEGLATVNTDKLKDNNRWFTIGHSYYSSSDRSILDLFLQIKHKFEAKQRLPPLMRDKVGEEKSLFEQWFLI